MKFVLIILMSHWGSGVKTFNSIPNFKTKADCERAASLVNKQLGTMRHVCVAQ